MKLVRGKKGFNQVEKRKVNAYVDMWHIDDKTKELLMLFDGELPPRAAGRNPKRMFINEFTADEQEHLYNFFQKNIIMIISDVIRGRGRFAVCFEGAISQSMLQEHYDIKDYFGKADYVYSDCGDGEFSLVFYIAQYEDKTIDYLFNDDGYHCNDLNKEMEEERQRAKAADKRMELFERGFKEQFMYER